MRVFLMAACVVLVVYAMTAIAIVITPCSWVNDFERDAKSILGVACK